VKYHQKTLKLVEGYDVSFDPARAAATALGAEAAGVLLPASVAEWYGVPARSVLWQWYSGEHWPAAWGKEDGAYDPDDDLFPTDRREDYHAWWLSHRGFWFDPPISHDLRGWVNWPILPLMDENQACWQWGVVLDGTHDPPAVITSGDGIWDTCADSFSTYVYSLIFDAAPIGPVEVSRHFRVKECVTARHRYAMREEFQIEPTTRGSGCRTGVFTERFSRPGQRLKFCNDEHGASDWSLSAADLSALSDLIGRLCRSFPAMSGALPEDLGTPSKLNHSE
jgi:hypothetical protein